MTISVYIPIKSIKEETLERVLADLKEALEKTFHSITVQITYY